MEKQAAEKSKDKKEIQISKAEARLRQAVERLAKTPDGQVVFRHLMEICDFSRSSIVMNQQTTEINPMSTVYMEARKTIYYHFRNLIPVESLKQIEFTKIDDMEE